MGFCYIRTTPGPENHASLLMHLGWLLRGGRLVLFTHASRTQEAGDHRPFLAASDPACLEPAACPQGRVFYGTGSGGVVLSEMEIAAHGQKVVFTSWNTQASLEQKQACPTGSDSCLQGE